VSVILTYVAGTLLVVGSGLVLHFLAQVDGVQSRPASTTREYVAPRRAA
jgi:hypothetical protein